MGERMTREEEIKARAESGYIVTTRTYIGPVDTLRIDLAEEDVRHLLARNEELQRRVERLESAVFKIRNDPYVYSVPRVMQILNDAMDAKEHPDV